MSGNGELTERQELALQWESLVAQTSLARVKRQAVSDFADSLIAQPDAAAFVAAVLRSRRERGIGRPVTVLRSIR